MRNSEPAIRINVDVTNPGQFFACCGLLELADRLWPGAEGWFENDNMVFVVSSQCETRGFSEILIKLAEAGLEGELSQSLAEEREQLEDKRRQLKKQNRALAKSQEQRRRELGTLLREGRIWINQPFSLHLDWWQEDDDSNPKTWAGSQQVLRIAQAALADAVAAFQTNQPFDFNCVMRPRSERPQDDKSSTGKRATSKASDKAEPFYFDSRHGANALPLDIGFSPNELGMESMSFPAVELLCLIGLQRCRPKTTDDSTIFEYFPWSMPLPISVVPAAVYGLFDQITGYRFENAYRTDQRTHKGYLPATPFWR